MVVLITGGARSGKSTFAEKYAAHLGTAGIYIATSPVFDEELRERVNHHQLRREQSSFAWKTVEEPHLLADVLQSFKSRADVVAKESVILVDCLILWLSNLLLQAEKDNPMEHIMEKLAELLAVLEDYPGTVLLVTNEVGDGIVPEYPLGRLFRDLAGLMNQRVASISDQVFLVTAGIPVELKSRAFRF
ncbi:adenosylcobinamide kinase/adenosylcobinamide phosphate guanyltransferase [Brevibacillus reuszeri]|uniref:Adenosylcobinamide kinase n=1 Tax=Brevibacillus reuszeri TaxID=54915 RepID=A0A0K9YUQ8_9BACL|nr:bifunctional adenosylcobinamide kinase/adenosylcobinamide-phosphate guanylyltransferase [Brevibacillus reuszeri]KNB72377.1 adenosylcobinamide-phosphate guanylyltransferase [Brevibacillus reuszeri]MED1860964.1 bifunctional adenosylcobinamide kinase/adenosylcobinamide-phosphate guanylyltransferase [Brevibacillus reuszeri]GED70522.1 adenosylcobinamide kinase/adenosylcobinamide phosphate guanyltransferase [Brevibacillus reuszeri]